MSPGSKSVMLTPEHLYVVICTDAFVAEDAVDVVRAFDPKATIEALATEAEAVSLIRARDRVTAAIAIGPRKFPAIMAVGEALVAHDAPLLALVSSTTLDLTQMPCRVHVGDLPFTNETIIEMLKLVHREER
ncbi:hypothetical protein ACOXXX_17770 [Thalassococcus sp. BH17M4-6]